MTGKMIETIAHEFKSMTRWTHVESLPLANDWRAERIKYEGKVWVFAFDQTGRYRGNYCESVTPVACWNYLTGLAAGTTYTKA
jgi:hypothetical protein